MHVDPGLEECNVPECDRKGEALQVVDGAENTVVREGVRCSAHAKEFLEVTS